MCATQPEIIRVNVAGKQIVPGKFLDVLITLPPAVADVANNGKRSKGEVKNTGVHSFGGFFSKLLCSLSTNGALCRYTITEQRKTDDKYQ